MVPIKLTCLEETCRPVPNLAGRAGQVPVLLSGVVTCVCSASSDSCRSVYTSCCPVGSGKASALKLKTCLKTKNWQGNEQTKFEQQDNGGWKVEIESSLMSLSLIIDLLLEDGYYKILLHTKGFFNAILVERLAKTFTKFSAKRSYKVITYCLLHTAALLYCYLCTLRPCLI